MKNPTMPQLITAFASLDLGLPVNEETGFSKLSQEAQDAIVWAATAPDDAQPPELSESVKDEIRQWATTD